jgi:hypothetical protein
MRTKATKVKQPRPRLLFASFARDPSPSLDLDDQHHVAIRREARRRIANLRIIRSPPGIMAPLDDPIRRETGSIPALDDVIRWKYEFIQPLDEFSPGKYELI